MDRFSELEHLCGPTTTTITSAAAAATDSKGGKEKSAASAPLRSSRAREPSWEVNAVALGREVRADLVLDRSGLCDRSPTMVSHTHRCVKARSRFVQGWQRQMSTKFSHIVLPMICDLRQVLLLRMADWGGLGVFERVSPVSEERDGREGEAPHAGRHTRRFRRTELQHSQAFL